MMMVPFDIAGSIGGHKSTQFSAEVSRNVYIDVTDSGRKGQHDFPGLKPWSTDSSVNRGMHVMAGTLYKISGTTLYSVSSAGALTSLATVPGVDRAIFANDGTNLLFVCNSSVYRYNGTLTTLSTNVTNPQSIDYINSQFIVTGDSGLFSVSDPGDPAVWNGLNVAEEESSPDALYRVKVFSSNAYMMGAESVVPWINSGVGNPPLDRQQTSLINFGIANKYAVTNTDQFLYWLSDDKKLYQCVGASARSVMKPGASHAIDSLDASTCKMSQLNHQGQQFIILSFSNRTLAYSESGDYWLELSSGTDLNPAAWYGDDAIYCYDKTLVADHRNGNIYELDANTYTDNGDTRLRVRTLPSFTGEMIGNPGKRITVGRIRLVMQCGVGLATGQGVNPVLFSEFSPDGGHTWGEEIQTEIGAMGEYSISTDIYGFSTGYDVRLRIKCSGPVFLSLFSGVAYIREAGY